MALRNRLAPLALLATSALIAAACSSESADGADSDGTDPGGGSSTTEAPAPSSTTTTVDAEDLALSASEPGEFGVGKTTVEVTGARDRQLPVEVWYPVDPADAEGSTPATYDFPGIPVPSGAIDGAPVAEGDFPLVVYSHGNGGLRYVSAFLTEHLASHGFVVMAPDHVGNTAIDTFTGASEDRTQVALDRPVDVSAVIDAALDGASGLEDVTPTIDAEAVGVIGHSFGGFTTLAVASGFGDTPADDRVAALVAMAPATQGLDDDALSSIDIPTLLFSATLDETVSVEENTPRPFALIEGRPLVRADIDGGGHQSFTDVCGYQDLVAEMPELAPPLVEAVNDYASEGCTEELIDIDEAHRVIRELTTAFLLQHLDGASEYGLLFEGSPSDDDALAVLELKD